MFHWIRVQIRNKKLPCSCVTPKAPLITRHLCSALNLYRKCSSATSCKHNTDTDASSRGRATLAWAESCEALWSCKALQWACRYEKGLSRYTYFGSWHIIWSNGNMKILRGLRWIVQLYLFVYSCIWYRWINHQWQTCLFWRPCASLYKSDLQPRCPFLNIIFWLALITIVSMWFMHYSQLTSLPPLSVSLSRCCAPTLPLSSGRPLLSSLMP